MEHLGLKHTLGRHVTVGIELADLIIKNIPYLFPLYRQNHITAVDPDAGLRGTILGYLHIAAKRIMFPDVVITPQYLPLLQSEVMQEFLINTRN